MEQFGSVVGDDPIQASRRLLGDLLDPPTLQDGATRWVEMTPPNVLKMRSLAAIYPRTRFGHVYRDGRDVAHSVATMSWGPDDLPGALAWWEETLVSALEEMVLLVSMEDLVAHNRDETLKRMFDFAGESIDLDVQNYFDLKVTGDLAHIGRWRQDLSEVTCSNLDEEYCLALERIVDRFPSSALNLTVK